MDRNTWKTSWLLLVSLMSGAPAYAAPADPPQAPAERTSVVRTRFHPEEIFTTKSGGDWQFDALVTHEREKGADRAHADWPAAVTHKYLATSGALTEFQMDMASLRVNAPQAAMSAMYRQPMGINTFAAAAAWGRASIAGNTSNNFLVEGRYTRHMRHQIFARAANVTSSGPDLTPERNSPLYPVIAGTVGYAYTKQQGPHELGVGVSITTFKVPPALESVYGERPLSYQIYLRLWPSERRR